MKILQVGLLFLLLFLRQTSGKPPSRRDNVNAVGQCGSGLACGPECQKLCLTQHNYYRALHNLPPVRCDPDLAESAQAWTDLQAQKGQLKRSPWRNLGQVAESISWKQWGWEGMADTRAAVPSAVRSWYTEKKGGMMDRTSAPVNFQTIVRSDITRLGCGIHVIPGDGTYVTSHYGTMPGGKALNDNIQITAARDPEPACQIKSGQREKCGNVSSPFMTPDVCLRAGCCYDDVFKDEPDVNWYNSEGSTWCYKGNQNAEKDHAMATSQETLATTSNPVTQVSKNKYDKATSMGNAVDTTNSSVPLEKNYQSTSMESTTVAPTNTPAIQETLNDGDVPPTGFFKDCVDQHNKLRAKHGVPPLKWSDKLATNALKTAKMNAKIGNMKHDPNKGDEGENIKYFGPPQPQCEGPKVGNCFQCREVINDWYNEINNYDFAGAKSKNGGIVLHFTQVVWARSTRVGLATAIGHNNIYIVARYWIGGNTGGVEGFIKNVPPLKGPGSTLAPNRPTPESIEGTTTVATPAPAMTGPSGKGTTSENTASVAPTTSSLKSGPNSKLVIDCRNNYGSSCYYFNKQGTKWTENREECKKKGGDLVSIETEGEWRFLKNKVQGLSNQFHDEWHIGLMKDGSTWKWVNDAPLTITHWQRGQPSGDGPYVVMAKNYPPGTQGGFNDLLDWIPRGYICERNKGPVPWTPQPPTGAVTPTAQAATTASATTTSSGEEKATGEPTGFFKDCLDQHNKLRAKHGVPPLKWSKKLADNALRVAKMNADLGRMKHDPNNNNEGENIAYFGPPQPKCEGPKVGNCFQCREVVDDWYGEIKDYDFAGGKSRNGGVVLHFTQVVWRKTTEMGMATAVGNNKVFSVARYSEKGNMLPEENFVKNVPPLI